MCCPPPCLFVYASTFSVHLFSGLGEVVLVIQSQRNSYHARRGDQRKAEILQQAAEVEQVTSGGQRIAQWLAHLPHGYNMLDSDLGSGSCHLMYVRCPVSR